MPLAGVQLAIVGAGPAGARAAALLAHRGLQVELFDAGSLAREKLCGGLLNRRCQYLLAEAGLDLPAAVRVGADQPRLEYPALEYHDLANRRRGRYESGYRNIDRGAFDAWLRGLALEAGATIHPWARVAGLRNLPGGVQLDLPAGPCQAAWLLDATGSAALSRRRIGPGPPPVLHCIQGAIRLDPPPDAMWAVYHPAFTPFFAWIIPKGDGRFLAGAGFGTRDKRPLSSAKKPTGPESIPPLYGTWKALQVLLEYVSWRGHQIELLDAKPRGAPLAHVLHNRRLWWGEGRVYAIGEAAGLTSPFSGEGLSYALASAKAAAQSLVQELPPRALAGCLGPELAYLRRAQFKAWVAARAWLRPVGFAGLSATGIGSVVRLPWRR